MVRLLTGRFDEKEFRMNKLSKAVVFALAALFLIAAEGKAQKAGDLKLEPYVFESASKERVDAEFGKLLVPENRRNPKSRLIELTFVRFKSTAAKPASPIVYLAGGPGGSGIQAARGTRFPLFLAMREVADVIALDQRGVGLSKPNLNCREAIDYPLDKAPSRAGLLAALRQASKECANRLRGEGIDLNGYNTNESADDLEDLRKALGARKISLWAISYGTHLSLATIKRHERRLDRVILAGTEGLPHTIKLPSNIQKHLEHIARLARADAEIGKEVPDFTGLMKQVFERLDRQPAVVEITDPRTQQKVKVTINTFALQILTANSFGGDEGALPARYYALSKGDYAGAAVAWARFLRGFSNPGSAMSHMMDCYSGISVARRRQIANEARTALLEDVMDLPQPDVCDAWGNPDLGEAFRAHPRSRLPVLFISGTFDVRTPVSNAEEVRKGFPNSAHLIIEGAVHSDPLFLSSPKIKDVMLEFMKGEKLSTTQIALAPLKFTPLKK
jgi:pimeloyl-ACP methyl ester carboxylesterase